MFYAKKTTKTLNFFEGCCRAAVITVPCLVGLIILWHLLIVPFLDTGACLAQFTDFAVAMENQTQLCNVTADAFDQGSPKSKASLGCMVIFFVLSAFGHILAHRHCDYLWGTIATTAILTASIFSLAATPSSTVALFFIGVVTVYQSSLQNLPATLYYWVLACIMNALYSVVIVATHNTIAAITTSWIFGVVGRVLAIFGLIAILVIIRGGTPRYRLEQLSTYIFNAVLPVVLWLILLVMLFFILW